jgi:serine/threonine-protein kinase
MPTDPLRGITKIAAETVRAVIIAACASTFAVSANAQTRYGAIAFSESIGAHGWSAGYPSRQSAEQRALNECAFYAQNCRIVISFRNACGVLVAGDGNAWAANWSVAPEAAKHSAMLTCSQRAESCQLKRWVCTGNSGPTEQGGEGPDGFVSSAISKTQFVNHNDSVMLMEIGEASEDSSSLRISYYKPSDKMRQLVSRGDLFVDGSIDWETSTIAGRARIYKWGCKPLEYEVRGVFRETGQPINIIELQGPAPKFGADDCKFKEFVIDHNSRLTFAPIFALAPRPRRDDTYLPKGTELVVTNVAVNDVLNIRERATPRPHLVAAISPSADGLVYLGETNGRWMLVQYDRSKGWVNSRFVLPITRHGKGDRLK